MPFATTGGSLVTGANIVDQSIGIDDLADSLLEVLTGVSNTLVPKPNWPFGTGTNGVTGRQLNSNTTLAIAQYIVSNRITLNKISFQCNAVGTAGTVKLVIYSEDGQTKLLEETTASISGTGVVSTTLGTPLVINPGVYWIGVLPVSTTDITVTAYGNPGGAFGELNELTASEPILNGTLTVTASTIPDTITPTSITGTSTSSHALAWRFDN